MAIDKVGGLAARGARAGDRRRSSSARCWKGEGAGGAPGPRGDGGATAARLGGRRAARGAGEAVLGEGRAGAGRRGPGRGWIRCRRRGSSRRWRCGSGEPGAAAAGPHPEARRVRPHVHPRGAARAPGPRLPRQPGARSRRQGRREGHQRRQAGPPDPGLRSPIPCAAPSLSLFPPAPGRHGVPGAHPARPRRTSGQRAADGAHRAGARRAQGARAGQEAHLGHRGDGGAVLGRGAHPRGAGAARLAAEAGCDVFGGGGLVRSPVEEQLCRVRVMEQGLEKTLQTVDGVLLARVHLVVPPPPRPGQAPTPSKASAMLRAAPGGGARLKVRGKSARAHRGRRGGPVTRGGVAAGGRGDHAGGGAGAGASPLGLRVLLAVLSLAVTGLSVGLIWAVLRLRGLRAWRRLRPRCRPRPRGPWWPRGPPARWREPAGGMMTWRRGAVARKRPVEARPSYHPGAHSWVEGSASHRATCAGGESGRLEDYLPHCFRWLGSPW